MGGIFSGYCAHPTAVVNAACGFVFEDVVNCNELLGNMTGEVRVTVGVAEADQLVIILCYIFRRG